MRSGTAGEFLTKAFRERVFEWPGGPELTRYGGWRPGAIRPG